MKILHITTFLFVLLLAARPAMAADPGHGSHDSHGGHDAAPHSDPGHQMMDHGGHQMDHSGHMGEKIHEAVVEGYQLAYHLSDNMARMQEAQKSGAMQGMDMSKVKSHHLMLYIVGPDGKPVSQAKVGFLVRNPDGTEQKIMTMDMAGGFAADVDLKPAGKFTITGKSVVDGKTLIEKFDYTVK